MKRTYKKIPDVFAQVLPFLQLSILISQILLEPFRSYQLHRQIINEAFKFGSEERGEAIVKLINLNREKVFSSSVNLKGSNTDRENLTHNSKKYFNNLKSFNEIDSNNLVLNKKNNVYERQLNNRSKRSNEKENSGRRLHFFSGNIFLHWCSRKEKFIYSQFKQKINKVLEINSYFNIHSDIDKLQTILLTQDQKKALPLWIYDYSVDSENNLNTQWLSEKDEIIHKTISAYFSILNNNEKSDVDHKLLSEIDIFNNEISESS